MVGPTENILPATDNDIEKMMSNFAHLSDSQRKDLYEKMGETMGLRPTGSASGAPATPLVPQVASILPPPGTSGPVSQSVLDFVVKWVTVAFIVVLVGAAFTLGYAVLFVDKTAHPPDVLVTIFTTSVGFIGGLLAPTSGGNASPGGNAPPPSPTGRGH